MRVAALLAGAMSYALALPPFDIACFGWVALVPLLLAVRGLTVAGGFLWGALAGFAAGWAVTWWLARAVAAYFDAGLLVGVAGMSAAYLAALGTTFGVFGAAAACALRRTDCGGHLTPDCASDRALLVIAALWTLLELARARLLGQPWALLGYTQHDVLPLVQIASVAGVPGLSFIVALGNAGIAEAVHRGYRGLGLRAASRALRVPLLLGVVAFTFGLWVLPGPHPRRGSPAGESGRERELTVALVQANLPPAFRWTRADAEARLLAHLRETRRVMRSQSVDLVLWPEHALGLYLDREPAVTAMLAELTRNTHTELLLGAPRWTPMGTFNSAWLLDSQGRLVAHYDKQRLVPFAEAPPVGGGPDPEPSSRPLAFSRGRDVTPLPASVPVAASICQEALYPESVHEAIRAGGAVLVNLANDGWLDFGPGVGSRQHAVMVKLRAVESRRWLARVATTGVSMVVDPWGRVTRELPPGVSGVLTTTVEPRRNLTLYVRWGDAGPTTALLTLLAVAVRPFAARRSRPLRDRPSFAHRAAA